MKNVDEIIRENNAKWEAADVTERKMMICKDVLLMLSIPSYNIENKVYCQVGNGHSDPRKAFVQDQVRCNVCAKGAMMVSRFRLGESKEIHKNPSYWNDNYTTMKALNDVFDEWELNKIESVFEYFAWGAISGKGFSPNSKERLRQIMQRIIFWKGNVEKALTCGEIPKLVIPT